MKKIKYSPFPRLQGRAGFVSLACLCAGSACAESALPQLNQVVVSGARREQMRDDLPLSMDVVSATDLEARQIGDIKDMVKDLPNVSVRHAPARYSVTGVANPVGRDDNAGVSVRGMGGNRVLLLVDGVRVPRSYVNGSNAFGRDAMALNLVKRVEVVRGPTSVLYGSDGLAGLVNFLTYEPVDFLNRAADSSDLAGQASARWSGDDEGLGLAATLAGRASDSVQWLLSAGAEKSGPLTNLGTNDEANANRTRPNPQTHHKDSVLGKVVVRPDARQKHVFTLEHVRKSSDTELLSSRVVVLPRPTNTATRALVAGESDVENLRRDRLTWDGRYVVSWAGADQLQALVSLQNADAFDDGKTLRNDGGVRLRDARFVERTLQANVQASKSTNLSEQWTHRLTYGVDLSQITVTSWFGGSDPAPLAAYIPKKYFPDARDSGAAVYAQSEFQSERWSLTPGLRVERYAVDVISQDGYAPPASMPGVSISGYHTSPKLGALWRLSAQRSVFANFANGFRAPSATQLNGSIDPTPNFNARLLPNPDLKPETSRNWELGYRTRSDRLQLDLAVFTGDYSQLIVDKKFLGGTNTVADPNVFQTVNVDSATIWGWEIKGVVDVGTMGHAQLSVPFAAGMARGRDNTTGRPLNTVDPASLSLGLQYETQGWSVRTDLRHVAAKDRSEIDPTGGVRAGSTQFTGVPSATTLDVSGQWRIDRNLRLTVSVVNLTNAKYWLWSDVQGLSTANAVTQADAYTQPGRHLNLALVKTF